MVVSATYPGVYVQEVPSGVHTIVGVSTSITLFIGRAANGPMLKAVRINTYADFLRTFGDDAGTISAMARYVRLFFINGGSDCYVIRIANGWAKSSVTLHTDVGGADVLQLTAKNPGVLGDLLRAAVTYNTSAPDATFNLEVFRWQITPTGTKLKTEREEFLNLSMDPASPNFAVTTLSQKSKLVDASLGGGYAGIAQKRGFSLSMVPFEATTNATFVSSLNTLLGTKDSFTISIGGKKPITVAIPATAVAGADYGAARSDLALKLQAAIAAKVTSEGITGLPSPPVIVSVLEGPTAVAGGSQTTLVRIAANADGQDIRITAAPTRDITKTLGWGVSNGGIEVGAFAAHRPAPTGITLKNASGLDTTTVPPGITTAPLIAYAGLLKNVLTDIRLDELDPVTGNLIPKDISLGTLPAARIWVDAASGNLGVLDALGRIRDAVNAYRASNPTGFFWRAELWGYRLALLNTSGDDNATVVAPGFTFLPDPGAGSAMAGRFLEDVRYFTFGAGGSAGAQTPGTPGDDGTAPLATDYTAAYNVARSDVDLFNLLVLPPDAAPAPGATLKDLWGEASALCNEERAFLIMDPDPSWVDTQSASSGVNALRIGLTKDYSAVYFPRLKIVENGREHVIGAAGAMAGLYARTDASRGVWKAPAGSEADVRGVLGVDVLMSDLQNGAINPVGVNAIRLFPEGVISWGARTMDGADAFASEYKYIPIRRLALFIEESLYRGLKWAVFEPNDDPLWASIRLNVGAFMHDLFRKGAFAGGKPSDAYFVKCDKETTTANDQNLGIVNIWVGFAPLKPAEFVVLYLQQIAQAIPT